MASPKQSQLSNRILGTIILVASIATGLQLGKPSSSQTVETHAQMNPSQQLAQLTNENAAPAAPKRSGGSVSSGSSSSGFRGSEVETLVPSNFKVGEPTAIVKTSMGEFRIRLFASVVPSTVEYFMALARGQRTFIDVKTSKKVQRPFYDGLIFHRVVRDYLIQGGCPFGTGRGGPGEKHGDEIVPNLRFKEPGMVAMAPEVDAANKMSKDSNGSQFFITLKPQPEMDGKYTIFGQVDPEGMEVVRKISQVKVGPTDRPIRRVYIQSITIIDVPQPNNPAVQPAKF